MGRKFFRGMGLLGVGVLLGLGVWGMRWGVPAVLTPSPAHAAALPSEPFVAFVGPVPFARGLLTMERLRAEGVAVFSGWVSLRVAGMGRPLDGVVVDGEALGWMKEEDRRWLEGRFREGVVVVVLGVDQDEVAPVLGLKRLRLPEEGVIPMGSLEYVMVYEVLQGDPRDIAIVREAGRFWESREFRAPAGIARPLYHGGGKAIGRLDSEGELRLLFHRLRMAIQGVYEIRAQYREALRTFERR